MNKTDGGSPKTIKLSQDAFTAHMQYASETVAKWPEWKKNVLAHTRPVRDSNSLSCKLESDKK